MDTKRALLIGIDEYAHFGNLGGCVNDVLALEPLLARHESDDPNFDCQTRTSANAGAVDRDDVLAAVSQLFSPGADVALLYFAGHGHSTGADVHLVTRDATDYTPGVAFSEILTTATTSDVNEIIVILDCCFAGAAGGIPQLGTATATLPPGMTILAASRGDQTSAETADGRGMFSTFLEGALDGGAAEVLGRVTVAGVFAYLEESFRAWDQQRPTFKANLDRLHVLRQCAPAVPLADMRQLGELFPAADDDFPLDPSYEPDLEPAHPEHEATFAILQRYRAAKLLVPVDEEHMYFAAANSKACRLTPLGRHYWHRARQRRI